MDCLPPSHDSWPCVISACLFSNRRDLCPSCLQVFSAHSTPCWPLSVFQLPLNIISSEAFFHRPAYGSFSTLILVICSQLLVYFL